VAGFLLDLVVLTMRVRLDHIAFDAGTQIRAAIDQQVVTDYAESMTNGATFPPIVLFHDGNQHYLADGFHRFMAAQRNQFRDIDADVRPGTKEDALWFALGANKTNGKRLTMADKRNAALVAIKTWPHRSGAQIAEQIGCSAQYVTQIKSGVATTFDLPDRVTGKDGVSYPASPTAAKNARREAEDMLRNGADAQVVRDKTGIGRETLHEIRRGLGLVTDKTKEGIQKRRDRMRAMAGEGYTSRQIADALELSEEGCRRTLKQEGIDVPADRAVGHIRKHDSNRIVDQIVADAENLTEGVNLIDFTKLDRDRLGEWADSLVKSRRALDGFIKRLLKEREKHGEAA
jgi:ParB-like chromosome segregation protein Spo0J